MNLDLISLKAVFERHNVAFAYLFGSRAKGLEREDSDLDLAVYVDREALSIKDEVELALNIADALKIPVERVNVVALNSADVPLLARILKDGIPIYSRDEDVRKKWERKAYREILMEIDLYTVYANRAFKRKRSAT